MKKFMIFLLVLIVLIAGAGFAASRLISIEMVEARIKTAFHDATGRDISFARPRFMFFPNIGVELNDVSVSNPSWASQKEMVRLSSVDVRFALRPLLDRRVEVKRFVLKSPVVFLEKNKGGEGNWDFSNSRTKPVSGDKAGGQASSPSGLDQLDVQLGAFEIVDADITYADQATGTSYKLTNVDLSLLLPDLQSAMQLDGSFDYLGKQVNLALGLDAPMALSAGKSSKVELLVNTSSAKVKFTGTASTSDVLLQGNMDAEISSLPDLLSWITQKPAEALPFKEISFKSGTELSAERLKLSSASLSFDEIKAGGDASIGFGSGRPDIYARLSIDPIDLDRFIAGEKADDAAADLPAVNKQGAPQEGWDDTPFDVSGLKAVNADLILQTGGFSLRGAEVGPSNLVVLLKGGVLSFKSSEATLFEGKFSSEFGLNAAGSVPSADFKFRMNGVQAKPVLATFAEFDKLSGAADADVDVSTSGKSQKAMISALGGKGSVTFRDGSLQGIDLVNIAKMIQSKLTDMSIGAGKTDFVELGGTFTITNGIATNKDLRMKGPLLQASGSGDIDLPKKYLSYRVVPVLTASSAVDNASGLSVPVDIKGPFNAIKVKPDYASAVRDVLKDPAKAKESLKALEDQLEPMKDNIKGNFKDIKNIKKDPQKAIDGLMGILGGGAPQPQPQPSAGQPMPQVQPDAQPVMPETVPSQPEEMPASP